MYRLANPFSTPTRSTASGSLHIPETLLVILFQLPDWGPQRSFKSLPSAFNNLVSSPPRKQKASGKPLTVPPPLLPPVSEVGTQLPQPTP